MGARGDSAFPLGDGSLYLSRRIAEPAIILFVFK